MKARDIIFTISNLLGLNFYVFVVPKTFIVIFQMFILSFGFYFGLYQKLLNFNTIKLNIYFFTDTLQVELFFAVQIFFLTRAIIKRKLHSKISNNIHFKMIKSKNKSERKFLTNLLVILVVRISKFVFVKNRAGRIFMLKPVFTELVLSSSDFMFEYYVSLLTANLRYIKNQMNVVNYATNDFLVNFWAKRDILERYSLELFVSVAYNFLQLIIALYYICMRFKFNFFNTITGMKANKEIQIS